jgi:hypothetical protein
MLVYAFTIGDKNCEVQQSIRTRLLILTEDVIQAGRQTLSFKNFN